MSSPPLDEGDRRQTAVATSNAAPAGSAAPSVPSGTDTPLPVSMPGGSPRELPIRPGDVLVDKYQVGAILGQGGVGVVLSAMHLLLNQKVAIKILIDDTDAEHRARFQREAQSAARLKGEHVARVLDMGQMPGGAPFIVMEFLEGRDLAATLEQRGALPIDEAVELVLHACEAMAEAHAAGIVHRDLKPANLFLTVAPDGAPCVKVVDFGISKDLGATGASSHRLTQTTSVFGSPLYMSPEQMRSTRLTDARSDLWSLGVILYELLTGRPPFDAELYPDLVLKVATEPAAPPSSIRPEVSAALDAAVLRCLEKRPDERFQDVAQLAEAIALFAPARAQASLERIRRFIEAAPQGRLSATPAVAGPPQPAWARTAESGARATRSPPQRQLGKVFVAALIGALVMGLGAVALIRASGLGPGAAAKPSAEPAPPAPQTATTTQGAQPAPQIDVVPAGSAAPEATAPPPQPPQPQPSATAPVKRPPGSSKPTPSAAPAAPPPTPPPTEPEKPRNRVNFGDIK